MDPKKYFEENPEYNPYRVCSVCGSKGVRIIQNTARPTEYLWVCPSCEWNDTVVDMLEIFPPESEEDVVVRYLLRDILYTVDSTGRKLIENTAV